MQATPVTRTVLTTENNSSQLRDIDFPNAIFLRQAYSEQFTCLLLQGVQNIKIQLFKTILGVVLYTIT
jgi:hypothetical protein